MFEARAHENDYTIGACGIDPVCSHP
jgi:hypothetical protein